MEHIGFIIVIAISMLITLIVVLIHRIKELSEWRQVNDSLELINDQLHSDINDLNDKCEKHDKYYGRLIKAQYELIEANTIKYRAAVKAKKAAEELKDNAIKANGFLRKDIEKYTSEITSLNTTIDNLKNKDPLPKKAPKKIAGRVTAKAHVTRKKK